MGEGTNGGWKIAYCAVYGKEQNDEWEPSVVIDGLILEKTPNPFVFDPSHLQDQEILIRHDHKVHEDHVGFYGERLQ